VVRYDSYGIKISDTNAGFDLPIGFAGGLADPLTGLVHFLVRDYDPQVGRWTARDPLLYAGKQGHLYSYVGSDPVNMRDPSGLIGVSGRACAGVCGGASVKWDGEGKMSFCFEVGIGTPMVDAEFDPGNAVDEAGTSTNVFAGAGLGPVGVSTEWKLKWRECPLPNNPGVGVQPRDYEWQGMECSAGPISFGCGGQKEGENGPKIDGWEAEDAVEGALREAAGFNPKGTPGGYVGTTIQHCVSW
jgi:RHS repeat-associated protein